MKKVQCPICGNTSGAKRCQNCGWDFTKDILNHPAAAKMPESEKEDFVRSLFKARAGYAMKFLDDSRTIKKDKAEPAVKVTTENKTEMSAKEKTEDKAETLAKEKQKDEVKQEKKIKPEVSIQPTDDAIVQKKTAEKNQGLRLWTILSVFLTAVSITLWSVLNYFMTMYQLQRFNENGGQADVIGTMLEFPLSLIIVPMMAAVFMTVAFDGSRVKNKGQRKWPAGKMTAIVLGWLLLVTLVFLVGQQFAGMDWRPLASDIIYPASSVFERLLLGGHTGTGLLAIPWACLLMYLPAALAARFGFCYKKDVLWKDAPERTWLPIPEHKIGGLLLAAAVMFSIKNNLNTRSYFMSMSNIVYYMALVIPLAVEAVIFTVRLRKGKDCKMAVYIGISVGILVQLLIPAITGMTFYSWEGTLTMQTVPLLLLYVMMKAFESSSGWRKKMGTAAAVLAGVPALMAVLGSFGSASVNLFSFGDRRMLAVWMFYMIPAGVAAFVVWQLQKIRSQRVVAVWRQQKIRSYQVVVPVLFVVLMGICMMMIIFNTPFVSSYYVGYDQFGARMAVEQCLQFSIGGGYLIYFAGIRKSANQ